VHGDDGGDNSRKAAHARVEKTAFLRESIIVVPPAETIRLPFYASTMTPCDTVIEKRIDGTSTDGCLLRR